MWGYGEEAERFQIKASYGDVIYLQAPFHLVQVQGLAMPPFRHRTVKSPSQDGATYLGFSVEPRPVQLAIHTRGCSRMDMWRLRREFQTVINPAVGSLRFRVSFRDGTIFELHDVRYDANMTVGTDGQPEPNVQAFGVRFMAYDPLWYRYPENSASPALTVITGLIFPITFPIIFGDTWISEDVVITNGGNWNSYPTIELVGPMRAPRIVNVSTGETLEFVSGFKIIDGQVVTITTQFGRKTVLDQNNNNYIGQLTPASDLHTFHLGFDPVITNGLNTVSFWASECTANSDITVRWYDRYLGL